MDRELYCWVKSACSQVLCCRSPFPILTPPAWSWALFHFGKMTPRQGDFPQAFPECGPVSENTLQFPVKALSSWGPSTPHLVLLESVPREKLATPIQQREKLRASAHCPAVSPELPGARPSPRSSQGPGRLPGAPRGPGVSPELPGAQVSPRSSQGLSFVACLDPDSAALSPGGSESVQSSEGACRPG